MKTQVIARIKELLIKPSRIVEMSTEGDADNIESQSSVAPTKKRKKCSLLLLYCTCLAVGNIGGPLLQRLYYIHGGNRKWLSSWLQVVAFPFLVTPLSFLYLRKSTTTPTTFSFIEPKLFILNAILGLIVGLSDYMYSLGLSCLSVSTSSLLLSTQLSFNAFFAFLIVKQKFTFYSLNSIILVTLGAIVLSLHTSNDRPPGISKEKYMIGFFVSLGAAALYGLTLPLVEMGYRKSCKPITYMIVMQVQFVINLSATIVCTVGMLINNDFKIIPREATGYGLGVKNYYMVLVASAIVWQISTLGIVGVINCTSSLFTGIFCAVLLPLTEVAAVIIYHEKFTGEKGMALALCLWGITSYFIGEYKKVHWNEPVVELSEDGIKSSEIDPIRTFRKQYEV